MPFVHDAGYFFGDAVEGVAQQILVVDTDAGDADDLRGNDVGAVQPSAQDGFDNGDIHLMIAEMQKRNGREDFKKGRPIVLPVCFFEDRMYPIQQIEKLFSRDHPRIDHDPLMQTGHVRGGVKPDLVAVGLHHFGQHRGGGAFALGSGNVDAFDFFMRISKLLEQVIHPAQIKCRRVVAKPLLLFVIGGGKQVFHRLFIGPKCLAGAFDLCHRSSGLACGGLR